MPRTQPKSERSFGLSVGAVCAVLGVYWLWRGRPAAGLVFVLVALGLIGGALVRPSALRIPNALWWRLSRGVAWVNSRLLLSAMFFGILSPLGLIFRVRGRDPLRRSPRAAGTGWTPYAERQHSVKHYDRMY